MSTTTVTIEAQDGAVREVEADVTRRGSPARAAVAVAYVVGGLLGGAACIVIPVLHLVTTWGLPLLGIVLALRHYRTLATVGGTFPCPACAEPITVAAAVGDVPYAMNCPSCRQALRLHLPEHEGGVFQ